LGIVSRGVIACLLLLLSFGPLRADEASVGILAGRWTYDSAKSRLIVSDLLITRTASRPWALSI
jgi:hypothetical protein